MSGTAYPQTNVLTFFVWAAVLHAFTHPSHRQLHSSGVHRNWRGLQWFFYKSINRRLYTQLDIFNSYNQVILGTILHSELAFIRIWPGKQNFRSCMQSLASFRSMTISRLNDWNSIGARPYCNRQPLKKFRSSNVTAKI